jgi:hypothetical protein
MWLLGGLCRALSLPVLAMFGYDRLGAVVTISPGSSEVGSPTNPTRLHFSLYESEIHLESFSGSSILSGSLRFKTLTKERLEVLTGSGRRSQYRHRPSRPRDTPCLCFIHNPYDGKTPAALAAGTTSVAGAVVTEISVDKGARGNDDRGSAKVLISGTARREGPFAPPIGGANRRTNRFYQNRTPDQRLFLHIAG